MIRCSGEPPICSTMQSSWIAPDVLHDVWHGENTNLLHDAITISSTSCGTGTPPIHTINCPSPTAGRETGEDAMLQTTTSVDDSSILPASFTRAASQRLSIPCPNASTVPSSQPSRWDTRHHRLAGREESNALHTLSKENIIGPCRKRQHLTPNRQSHLRASPRLTWHHTCGPAPPEHKGPGLPMYTLSLSASMRQRAHALQPE